jgi:predicted ArsR family transcriptional regulator
MLRVYRYRLYPTRAQDERMRWTCERLRELYNAALEERREASGAAPRKRSGGNVHEAQRGTEAVKLRLPPGYAAKLRTLAESDGYSISEWVASFVDMAERDIQRPPKR